MPPPVTVPQKPFFLRSEQLVSHTTDVAPSVAMACPSNRNTPAPAPTADVADGGRTIKENQSFDNSVMINGDSVGTSIQTQNNYINITIQKSKRRREKPVAANKPPIVKEPQTPAQKEMLKLGSPSTSTRVLKLRSNIDNSRVPIYATDDFTLQSNWISANIVQRLGLKCKMSPGVVSAGSKLVSNGQFVIMSSKGVVDAQGNKVYEKFHVVEEASFDILYGKLELHYSDRFDADCGERVCELF